MDDANCSASGGPAIRPGDVHYQPPKWVYIGLLIFASFYPFIIQWTGAICKWLAFVFVERYSPSEECFEATYITAMLGMFLFSQFLILSSLSRIIKKIARKWGTEIGLPSGRARE